MPGFPLPLVIREDIVRWTKNARSKRPSYRFRTISNGIRRDLEDSLDALLGKNPRSDARVETFEAPAKPTTGAFGAGQIPRGRAKHPET